ncbi:SDR family NAD(P)-dependent oxidoreductase [Streptomyces anulatus]|uniref:SDR family NAD(P)-dependent oxidoreductase n=1 Tax=Streptomyces anulatus TaxID=1892 RepID=UPI00224D3B2C|nr:SDR family NAD(P)-dependent oxidoreductase [Streptomyces anulatus]MCX4523029.1 SDR family NAD(P)-dependent oxidoreductase [Streptomyces anulatus]MCX4606040.1 SDR family NAD(P)-dependent oxidoreductase [Streptomyces anulatus]
MDNVKAYILEQVAQRRISRDEAKKLLLELTAAPAARQDVAIVGMAGRYAAAGSVEEFWDFLRLGKSGVRDFPRTRKADMYDILRNPYYSEVILGTVVDESDLDRIYSMSGYLDRIDRFDARFFGIPPLEADYMDPHQRIGLEVAYEAFENAGYGGDSVRGTRTGVFLGRDQTNYSYYRMFSERHAMQLSGSWEGLVASRISYVLDLTGPCVMIDTACSAGAVSIHQAVRSLQAGECDMALAGGLNMSQAGEVKAAYMSGATMDSVESRDSAVRTFDARADGTVWGEGAGIVVLKPLARALADRDHIRAVIKGSAINNDGMSSGITAPRAEQQEQVILDAWARAGVEPETITYVEAHGTGTALGDPIETKGLSNAFRRHTSRRQFCGVGSLKTTMGHMVGASGVAAVTKVVKALETGVLPPTANFEVPNPYIDFPESPLYVHDRLADWDTPAGTPRRGAVSSFGFVRTNCHLVLEEAPAPRVTDRGRQRYCLTVSARTDEGLRELLDRYAELLTDSAWSFADICYTSNVGRAHHEHRLLITARSREELAASLERVRARGLGTDEEQGVHYGVHAVVSDKKGEFAPGDVTRQTLGHLSAEAEAAVDAGMSGEDDALALLAPLYVRGARVDFTRYHARDTRRRVPLPTYPFARTRHWARPLRTQVKGFGTTAEHPLLGAEISRSDSGAVFENTLSAERHWVLSDHRIEHRSVVPGTTYLEMARAAHTAVAGTGAVRFQDVVFRMPLSVDADGAATVRTRLDRSGDGYTFQVASRDGEEWVVHVEGRVGTAPPGARVAALDFTAVKRAADSVTDPVAFEADTGVFQFGPRWDSVRAEWRDAERTLALLRLTPGLDAENTVYGLHPAMLDNAVNVRSQRDGETFLPYMYKDFLLYRAAPASYYSLVRTVRDGGPGAETITFDIDLTDLDGEVFGQISGYTVKKVDWARFSVNRPRRYLRVGWEETAPVEEPVDRDASWAVVVRDTAAGRDLVEALTGAGARIMPCYLGSGDAEGGGFTPDEEGVRDLCARLRSEKVRGLLFAADFTAGEGLSHADRRGGGVDALFELYRGLVAHRVKLPLGLRVLGGNAWLVAGADTLTDPYAAATAALAMVVGQEHLPVGVVDAHAGVAADLLARECLGAPGAAPRAIRGTQVYVRCVDRVTVREDEGAGSPYTGGTFLVTGGAGGLGLCVAEEMAAQGAERIILLGRRALDERTAQRVGSMGVADYLRCDASRAEEVRALGERLRADGVRLTGIVHAAGVAGAGYLASKPRDVYDAVLAPKAEGSIALLELAAAHPDPFVVFFSSITALMGGHGQGDYSAANAFMDSLAAGARTAGVRALSVNWPTWTETGMAVDYGVDPGDVPFTPVSVPEGLAWLAYFLRHPADGVVPADFNLPVLHSELGTLPFTVPAEVAEVARATADAPRQPADAAAAGTLTGLSDPTPTQRRIAAVYGAVLGLAEIDAHTGFQDLGGNSLMTATLLTQIEQVYPGKVDIADLFSYSTVVDLAAYIDGQGDPGTERGAGPAGDQALQEALAEIGDPELMSVFRDFEDEGERR